jgi:hypothetical protein
MLALQKLLLLVVVAVIGTLKLWRALLVVRGSLCIVELAAGKEGPAGAVGAFANKLWRMQLPQDEGKS